MEFIKPASIATANERPLRNETPQQLVGRILRPGDVTEAVKWELIRVGPISRRQGVLKFKKCKKERKKKRLKSSETRRWEGNPAIQEYLSWKLSVMKNGFADEETGNTGFGEWCENVVPIDKAEGGAGRRRNTKR